MSRAPAHLPNPSTLAQVLSGACSSRDLLSPGYTETYTGADGVEVTEQLQQVQPGSPFAVAAGHRVGLRLVPSLQDHCLYQGHVEGQPVSAASLSTCNGLRWALWGLGVEGIKWGEGLEAGPREASSLDSQGTQAACPDPSSQKHSPGLHTGVFSGLALLCT